MIDIEHVTFTYDGRSAPALRDVDIKVPAGDFVLVVGPTGSGKSTLLRCINGLVPHFTGGTLRGRVTVAGRDTRTHPPRELADIVGLVVQQPQSGFVTDVVEDELAYGMESIGLPPAVMRRRVEETLDLLGLADLRDRPLLTLSAGERQRVAVGAALTAHPAVLVLDEPTSALDPGAAEDVIAALQRLVHDLGLTVVISEHRLERVIQHVDAVVVLEAGRATMSDPRTAMAGSLIAPPVVELARAMGWSPLPLSVREARRFAVAEPRVLPVRSRSVRPVGRVVVEATDLQVSYAGVAALRGVDLAVRRGETVALMGRNGAGKSTLLRACVGLAAVAGGSITVEGRRPGDLRPRDLLRLVGLVPSDPGDLLIATTVSAECAASDHDTDLPAGTTSGVLAAIAPDVSLDAHPRDLSEGQRLALALAIVLAPEPAVLLLDEPTGGLDYQAKRRLAAILRSRSGTSIVLATHDVELAAEVADRVVVLADGDVVADGSTAEIVTASPMFSPQTAKIMSPQAFLTVDEVTVALAGAR